MQVHNWREGTFLIPERLASTYKVNIVICARDMAGLFLALLNWLSGSVYCVHVSHKWLWTDVRVDLPFVVGQFWEATESHLRTGMRSRDKPLRPPELDQKNL